MFLARDFLHHHVVYVVLDDISIIGLFYVLGDSVSFMYRLISRRYVTFLKLLLVNRSVEFSDF